MTSLAVQMRRLGKHSAVYGLGGIVSRVIAVFLLPIYTRYLDREDLGAVGLVVALSAVLVTILPARHLVGLLPLLLRLQGRSAPPARRPHVVLVHDGERDGRARRRRPARRADRRPARARRREPRARRLRGDLGADELRAADVAVPRRGAVDGVRAREPREHRDHDRGDRCSSSSSGSRARSA